MEAIYLFGGLVIYAIGLATGIYFASQIEKHIDNNIKKKR
jgi:hypothetical protein